jgi:hypothetical protein
MSGGFNNDILGGDSTLIRAAIQSPNFKLSPLTGWSIDKNGNAYFESITIGGGVVRVTFAATAPASPNVGDVWFNLSAGAQPNVWSGSAWTAYQWGTSSIAASSITSALIAAGTIVAGIVDGTLIEGAELLIYSGGTPVANELQLSVCQSGFTDSVGNIVLPGFTYYNNASPWYAVNIGAFNGTIEFYLSAGNNQSSGWGQTAQIAMNTDANNSGNIGLRIMSNNTAVPVIGPNAGFSVNQPGTTYASEQYHTASLDAGWTGNVYYKLSNDGLSVKVFGAITHAAFAAAVNVTSTTPLPSAYWPKTAWNIGGTGIPTRAGGRITAAGIIIAEPNGVNCTECDIAGEYPLGL